VSQAPDQQYLRLVARRLAGLGRRQRRELLADLAAHLAENPQPTLAAYQAEYGDLRAYAVELRRSAGLKPEPPVRPVALVVAILAIVVAASGIGLYEWGHHFQPLLVGSGCFRSDPLGTDTRVGALTERTVIYDDGAPIRVVWTLSNLSGRPVTATRLVFPDEGGWLIKHEVVGVGMPRNRGSCDQAEETPPFKQFVLHPHESRNIVVSGIFGGCETQQPGDSVGLETVQTTISVFAVTHTFQLKVQPYLTIAVPTGYQCPRVRQP
jgi:hypothetical protein